MGTRLDVPSRENDRARVVRLAEQSRDLVPGHADQGVTSEQIFDHPVARRVQFFLSLMLGGPRRNTGRHQLDMLARLRGRTEPANENGNAPR
jgi:hypothetical protein